MVFSSLTFLYFFLPIVLVSNYLTPNKYRNYTLLLFSFIFYAWGGISLSFLLFASVVYNYFSGLLIGWRFNKIVSKTALIIGITGNLCLLAFYKYADFIAHNIIVIFQSFGLSIPVEEPGIILPIGISFFTFQAISYLVDVYREKVEVQYNFINLSLYISLFPQLIAGPIVRYHDIADQLIERKTTTNKFVSGIKRFVLGLAKKVLIANQFAFLADAAFQISPENLSTFVAWAGIVAYSLQIYFDFSGYSDMAIGLGRMLGFEILENFNFPYIAKSIREFWRRWHISLTNWFRDYLYIPLGGSRKNQSRTYFNLIIVFLLTGLWHGASWGFIAWGLLHGTFMIIERVGFERVLNKLWSPLQHIYTLFVVLLAWVLFRADDFNHAMGYYHAMFSIKSIQVNRDVLDIFLNDQVYLLFMIALISSTKFWLIIYQKAKRLTVLLTDIQQKVAQIAFSILLMLFIGSSMLFSTIYLIANTYNPFIYYRF